MAEFQPKPGSFLPFLQSSKDEGKPLSSAPVSPLTVLDVLYRQAQQSLPIFDLQTLSGIAPARYADALKSLSDAGYIKIDGAAPEETVHLTPAGEQVVKLARPA